MNKQERGVIKWAPFHSLVGQKQLIDNILKEKKKISNGMAIIPSQPFKIDEFVTLMDKEKLAAIAKSNGKFLKCEKVFL